MGFIKQNRDVSPRYILKNWDKIRDDLAIQRNDVWKLDRRSLFIHSLIVGYPVPPLYAVDKGDGLLWILDGKQRMKTCLKYLNNEFALTKDTPDVTIEINGNVEDVQIAGKTFDELPQEVKDELATTKMLMYTFQNITEEEISEMFRRLNAGVGLTKMELNRVLASVKARSFIKEICKKPFFEKAVAIKENAKNRFTDEEAIWQIVLLLNNGGEACELSTTKINEFILSVKDTDISDEIKDKITNITNYLGEVFTEINQELKKTTLPILFTVADKAVDKNVDKKAFGEWFNTFMTVEAKHNGYKSATTSSSAKKDRIAIRLEKMHGSYDKAFGDKG